MQNKGTDYIRKILKDKVRLKRWRKVMLCLSCIVVFCTVYVLILPAITLERKTICGQEEHVHTEECYSVDGQLICGDLTHTFNGKIKIGASEPETLSTAIKNGDLVIIGD